MAHFLGYRCSLCGGEFSPADAVYTCPHCQGNLDVVLDIESLRQKFSPDDIFFRTDTSLWRYLPLLPVGVPSGSGTPLHNAGWTPVYTPPRLRELSGLHQLWVKDDGRNPTASFKDRASAVVVTRAMELKAHNVVTASTGNAGAALAGMAAAVGQKAIIFAPRTAPPAKVAQLLIYGAQVILLDGSYDDAFDLTVDAAREFGWYCRNTGYNPFTAEGKKTAAFEIWETIIRTRQLNRPLSIFVSVGDGNIISGIHKGFRDLAALGWLEEMPRIFGVQAQGSAAVANAWRAGKEHIIPVKADTLADSISVDLPRDGVRAIRAARETNGAYIVVSDAEILAGISDLGSAGIFAEPAGAAAWAGLQSALKTGIITEDDPVLVLNTGSGLKDIRVAMQAAAPAPIIEPTLAALRQHLSARQ